MEEKRIAINKNQEYEIQIKDINTQGEGVGHISGYTLFVKDTLIGDKVLVKVIKVKKGYGYGRLIKVLEPSPNRVEAKCPAARKCGGCQLQHLEYKKQLEYKEKKVKDCLSRIAGFKNIPMEPIVGMENPYYYRNKAQFPVGQDKDGKVIAGFYAGRTHSIIDITDCCIQAEINSEILKVVKNYMQKKQVPAYNEKTHTGLVRHILTRVGFSTGEVMICLVINGINLPYLDYLVEKLKKIKGMVGISINVNQKRTNVIMGDKLISVWGRNYIIDYIGEIKYQISPFSFYQVNPIQTVKLYETVLEYANLSGKEIVWDLYCGIGTISLFLAKHAKYVYGVEIVPWAIEDAKKNADINGILNTTFFVGAAEEILPKKYAKDKEITAADVVIVDPPRKGCEKTLLDTLLTILPDKIVYVSCDPATLARDLKYLCDNNYQLKKIKPFDMFGMSVHCEVCVELCRK